MGSFLWWAESFSQPPASPHFYRALGRATLLWARGVQTGTSGWVLDTTALQAFSVAIWLLLLQLPLWALFSLLICDLCFMPALLSSSQGAWLFLVTWLYFVVSFCFTKFLPAFIFFTTTFSNFKAIFLLPVPRLFLLTTGAYNFCFWL